MKKDIKYRLGIDIGGTFTDIALLGSDGSIETKKVSSTPSDYSIGILNGLTNLIEEKKINSKQISAIVHATTIATNTILELKGAKTALLTTKGFRDVLEMRRLRIPVLYNLQYEKPDPIVPRRYRYEVNERIGPTGDIWLKLDQRSVESIIPVLNELNFQSIAICFLHSYANPEHEEKVTSLLRKALNKNTFITSSVNVLPEIREYERTSTTIISAYIGPVVKKYLTSLVKKLKKSGYLSPVSIMQSNGGLMKASAAIQKPAYILESGPAAGVIACAKFASMTGHKNIISLDMGGTTAKTALVENGEPSKTSEYEVGAGINLSSKLVKGGGYPIKLPFIDVSEIGAGGGSILNIDDTGILKVGPESAGADPGPICYNLGGKKPTLTDSLVLLGFLNPKFLVGGSIKIDFSKTIKEFKKQIATPLGKSNEESAWGALMIAVSNMTRAVKAVSTYQGRDPRDFSLFAFGGNGPVTSVFIAKELQIRHVLVPPASGVFSALGLLFSEPEREIVKTFFQKDVEFSASLVEANFMHLEDEAKGALIEEGYEKSQIQTKRYADLRYSGQAYELTVSIDKGKPEIEKIIKNFSDEHYRTYGHKSNEDPVDLINIKVIAKVNHDYLSSFDKIKTLEKKNKKKLDHSRRVYFGSNPGLILTPIINRNELSSKYIKGPLIIEEYDSTCVIPPFSSARLDSSGNIEILVN